MIISGLVILSFLVLHFYDFWVPEMDYKYIKSLPEDPNRYYEELIEKFENKKDINTILLTSNTLSSLKIIEKLKLKKVIHQFFPIDHFFFSNKFLHYWKPSVAIFLESEIWPSMFKSIKNRGIPTYWDVADQTLFPEVVTDSKSA